MPYIDSYYIILVLPAVLLSLWAQMKVKGTFAKYSGIFSSRGITGDEAARSILRGSGITNVTVHPVAGELTDRFDPRDNTIGLSQPVYGNSSVAAIGVAAHETGHAIQHAEGYLPIKLRAGILPIANLGSAAAVPIAILGFVLGSASLVNFGILLFSAVVAFQLVTLPVEFNASRRALAILKSTYTLNEEELEGAKKVLTAAALTYVAAALTSLMSLLRLILISRNRD